LLIEVKGGLIRFDGEQQSWSSTDRDKVVFRIDPVRQVLKSKHALLDKLRSVPALQNTWINICHGLAFPNGYIPERTPHDAPRDILIGIDEFQYLSEKIDSIFQFYFGDRPTFRNGHRVVGELQSILGRSTEFANPLSKQVAGEERQIVRLTEEQFQVLDALNR